MIRAKPTTYKGVRFRSRLEAKWACFFDLAGWRWEYEPIDTEGWVPDFVLQGDAGNTWVEVKPIEWVGQSVDSYIKQARDRPDLTKVWGQDREALILGLYPVPSDYDAPFLGVIANEPDQGADTAVIRAGYHCALDFHAFYGSFAYRIGGQYSGDHHIQQADWGLVGDLWRRAGTLTQWRAA